jgi:hypothetical protein
VGAAVRVFRSDEREARRHHPIWRSPQRTPAQQRCLPLPGEGLGPPVIRKGSWIRAILPAMKTDIVLDPPGGGRRVVVGTKFTSILQAGRFGDLRLKCGYLYRMYAYLRSQEGRPAGIKQEDSFSILRSMARCGRSR